MCSSMCSVQICVEPNLYFFYSLRQRATGYQKEEKEVCVAYLAEKSAAAHIQLLASNNNIFAEENKLR